MKHLFSFLFLLLAAPALHAQSAPPADDTSTIDGLVRALYDVISGPAGPRDWVRFERLYHPSATMGAAVEGKDGTQRIRTFTPAEYVRGNGPYLLEHSFYEKEVHRDTRAYGAIAQVFTTYESKIGDKEGPERGINALQLLHDGRRWWIISLIWQSETKGLPLPEQYLR